MTEKRNIIECNFIFAMYKDMNLIGDYTNVVNGTDIITEDGQFYFGLLKGMDKAGYQSIDNMSIYSYLSDKDVLRKGYERRGGWNSIQEIMELTSTKNIEVYYDELVKDNMLIRLKKAGFNIDDKIDKFAKMSSEDIYDYYEYQLANIVVDKIHKTQIEDLSDGWEEWMDRADSSKNIGFKIGSPILDYQMAGIHQGCLTLYLGGIGQGKSSSSVGLFILPAIETGNDITIICNEQTADEYRAMIISTVLFSRIKNVKGINRMSITLGGFGDYKKGKIREAAQWIKNQSGKIKFVEMENYDATNIKKIITKQSKLGCNYFFFDTFKSVNDASDRAWAELSDTAKMLSIVAKKENVAIIASAQLASDSMFRKYLDLSAVGKSRAISECATAVLGFRPIMNNEIENIKPWKWKQSEDGSLTKIKTTYDLDPNKHYIMQFIMKNRWGSTNLQVVQEFNQEFNTIKDVGYYNASYDDFRR